MAKTKWNFFCIVSGITFVLSVLLFSPFWAEAQKKGGSVVTRVKMDLLIHSFTIERTGVLADGSHSVLITAKVRLFSSASATCGPFKMRLEYRDGPAGAFTYLGEAGVASLSSGGTTIVVPTETRTFNNTVPLGRTRTYRLTVDPMNQVAESNEGNNQAEKSYSATGCAGSDLVLTKVELRRTSSGGVLVKVWVKNRCLNTCEGEIVYIVDEREALASGRIIEQGIGSRIEGETEYGPLGNMLAAGRSGHDLTYIVSIEVRGGTCRESSTANNSCRVTIRASETTKTQTCSF